MNFLCLKAPHSIEPSLPLLVVLFLRIADVLVDIPLRMLFLWSRRPFLSALLVTLG